MGLMKRLTSIIGATILFVLTSCNQTQPTIFPQLEDCSKTLQHSGRLPSTDPCNLNDPSATNAKTQIPNLAKTAEVTVLSTSGSPHEDSRWSKGNVVDGIRDSVENAYGWSSERHDVATGVEWIQFDFGATKNLNRVDLYPRNDESYGSQIGDGFPVDFMIEISDDGITWVPITSQVGYPKPPEDDVQTFTFARATARYVRVSANTLGYVNGISGYHFQVAEIEIYDTPETLVYTFSNGET